MTATVPLPSCSAVSSAITTLVCSATRPGTICSIMSSLRRRGARRQTSSIQVLVRRQGQEGHELIAERQPIQNLRRLTVAPGFSAAKLAELFVPDLLVECLSEWTPIVQSGMMVHPLPELRARDFGGGCILHQIEDRRRPVAEQPGVQVLQADADVVAHTAFGDLTSRHVRIHQLLPGDLHLFPQPILLVRLITHDTVENLHRYRNQIRMRYPGAVEAIVGLALF